MEEIWGRRGACESFQNKARHRVLTEFGVQTYVVNYQHQQCYSVADRDCILIQLTIKRVFNYLSYYTYLVILILNDSNQPFHTLG